MGLVDFDLGFGWRLPVVTPEATTTTSTSSTTTSSTTSTTATEPPPGEFYMTRLYLNCGAETPELSPTPSASWDVVSAMSQNLGLGVNDAGADEFTCNPNYGPWPPDPASVRVGLAQFVSPPLEAQEIGGTLRGQIQAVQMSADDNCAPMMIIRVMDGTCTTVRGTLLSYIPSAVEHEFDSGGLTNRKFPQGPMDVTPVEAQAGDRLVIEIGFRCFCADYEVTGPTGQIQLFANALNEDLGVDETDTDTSKNAWIDFQQMLSFQSSTTTTTT